MIRFEQVRRWALQDDARIALTWPGGSWTYTQLATASLRFALELEGRGVGRGQRVALVADNTPGTIAAVLGIQAAGATLVPVNFRLTPVECDTILQDAGPTLLLFDGSESDLALRIPFGGDRLRFELDGVFERAADPHAQDWAAGRWSALGPHDIETVIYTSGTTGLPKGVVTTPTMVTTLALSTAITHHVTADSCWLQSLPYFSAASLNLSINTIFLVGGRLHLLPSRHFEPGRFLEEAARSQATHTELVPTQLYRVLDHQSGARVETAFDVIGYGSAPMSEARLEQGLAAFGPIFIQAYGMTETTCQATLLLETDHVPGSAQLQSAGRALPHVDVMVADDSLREVPPGAEGEICFRGITVTPGYWQTGGAWRRTGFDGDWLRSGDIGRTDERGFIYVVDRKKDLVISGGFNISSREIEDVIYRLDGVLECAVIGEPHPDWGEIPVAFIVPATGATLSATDVITHCRSSLAGFKVPHRVEVLGELPKNSIGKILKRELRSGAARKVEA